MPGEENLQNLLKDMSPSLDDEEYVFISKSGAYGDFAHLSPLCSFMEKEGLTLIIPRTAAEEKRIKFQGVFRKITLEVHSSLEAVGLTAAVAVKLKENNISANVVAAYYHDHIFVQSDLSEKALNCLKELSN